MYIRKKSITFINDDSLNFLKNFQKKIDFLYLDSFDGYLPGASEYQLKEIKFAENKLHSNSLILLDDMNSKSNLSIDYMLERNFKILNKDSGQVLLSY